MKKIKGFLSSWFGMITVALAVAAPVAMIGGGYAGADSVDDGFTALQSTLTGYLGDAIALVLALVGLAVGIRMLVKWAKRAASA